METSSAAAAVDVGDSGGAFLQTYKLANDRCLTVAQGSVVDFGSRNGAIVNAANEGCLFGGGVDGAITSAGGPNLADDRLSLPRIEGDVRCYTGDAKLTGPGDYGALRVPFVIHAVGPNYMMFDEENDVDTPHGLLHSAYYEALGCTLGQPIDRIAFALLSAGVYRGEQSLATVLSIGVQAIRDWSCDQAKGDNSKLKEIILYAFTDREAKTLLRVCDHFLLDKETSATTADKSGNDENPESQADTTMEEIPEPDQESDSKEESSPAKAVNDDGETDNSTAVDQESDNKEASSMEKDNKTAVDQESDNKEGSELEKVVNDDEEKASSTVMDAKESDSANMEEESPDTEQTGAAEQQKETPDIQP